MRLFLCPTGKMTFGDAATAWARLCEIRADMRADERRGPVTRRCPKRIYQCTHCGYWHLTSERRMVSS
jgi:hypothetical protein